MSFAERETREAAADFDFSLLWFVPGYLVAVAIHTAFNQFPDQPLLAMMGAILVAPIAIMAIFRFGAAEAQHWLAAEAPSTARNSMALRAGRLAGRARAAERSRRSPSGSTPKPRSACAAIGSCRRGWCRGRRDDDEEAAGDATIDKPQVRAAFAELDGLKRALGRSTFAALKALLPFSRNDYWEMSRAPPAHRRLSEPTAGSA